MGQCDKSACGASDGGQPVSFVGRFGYYTHYQEPSFGLLQLGVRYYDPSKGRFTQKDPIEDGLNWYAYAGNNPVNAVDPSGLDTLTTGVLGGLRMVGGAFETVAGYGLAASSFAAAAATSPTGIGAVGFGAMGIGGVAIGLHGVDTFQAGLRQMVSGNDVDSLTSTGLQKAGMSPFCANLTDAGIGVVGSFGAGLATGAVRASTIAATDPLAEGLSWTQILTRWEVGSKALNNADFAALGGSSTSPLFKASYISQGVNMAGNPLTTTTLQQIGKSAQLWHTGLTPLGYVGAGVIGSGVEVYSGYHMLVPGANGSAVYGF